MIKALFIGTFVFSVCAALKIEYIKRKDGARSDVVIGLFWPLGMALGILFITLMSGYSPDLFLIADLIIIVTFVIVALFNNWKVYLFDDEFASIIGIKTAFLEYLLLILIAMTVIGIILVLALLTALAAIVGMLTSNQNNCMIYSILLGNVFYIFGSCISYKVNIASGAITVILSVVDYFISYTIRSIFIEYKRKRIARGTLLTV